MAHFLNRPKGERISGQTVEVRMGQPVQIGLYGFQESPTRYLTLMTYPVVQWNSIRDQDDVRTYGLWDLAEGEVRVEAVASTRAVWDWIKLRVTKPKGGTPRGIIPDAILKLAIAARSKWGVPISVTLAQWAIESDWGSRTPSGSNNPFGMKAGTGQPSSNAATEEENPDGTRGTIVGAFRKFSTLEQAFDEHAKLLATNPVYAGAMANKDDPDKFADGLRKYASASNYTVTLKHWMKVYDLYQYDKYGRWEPYIFPDEIQIPP
jgi:Mannosyl-glycoprotein endo-beta-N-acetylglucosaminidase